MMFPPRHRQAGPLNEHEIAMEALAYEACGAPYEHPTTFPSREVRYPSDGEVAASWFAWGPRFERAIWAHRGYEPPEPPPCWGASYYANDMCPSYTLGPLELWVDHPVNDERERSWFGPGETPERTRRCALVWARVWSAEHGWDEDRHDVCPTLWEGDSPEAGFAEGARIMAALALAGVDPRVDPSGMLAVAR